MTRFVNTKSIAIMLSTYNGEKYIRQLVDSILEQTCSDFTLYIRDDGSDDDTLKVISGYLNNSSIKLFPNDGNKGANMSFLYMLANISSKYYMFCDQDDIWKRDKVEITLNAMKKAEEKDLYMPIIVHTDLTLVDTNLNIIDASFWHYLHHNPELPHDFNYYCHYVDVTGCTMMFNEHTKKLCSAINEISIPKSLYYDRLISLLVSRANGCIVPVLKSTVIYRRHNDTTTNPIGSYKSIFRHPWDCFSYVKSLKKEHSFYKRLGYGGFIKFLFYRIRLVYLRRKKNNW